MTDVPVWCKPRPGNDEIKCQRRSLKASYRSPLCLVGESQPSPLLVDFFGKGHRSLSLHPELPAVTIAVDPNARVKPSLNGLGIYLGIEELLVSPA